MWHIAISLLVSAHPALVEVLGDKVALASGVRVSLSHVITNAHAVAHDSGFSVVCGGREVRAHVVATDEPLDLALLEIEKPQHCVTSFAVFRAIGAFDGEWLRTSGCPYGRCRKVTRGEVIARFDVGGQDRLVTTIQVRPGSSGGPAYDDEGEIVGVVYAHSRDVADPMVTYGMLIPVDHVITFLLGSCRLARGTPIAFRVGTVVGEHFCPTHPPSTEAVATTLTITR